MTSKWVFISFFKDLLLTYQKYKDNVEMLLGLEGRAGCREFLWQLENLGGFIVQLNLIFGTEKMPNSVAKMRMSRFCVLLVTNIHKMALV